MSIESIFSPSRPRSTLSNSLQRRLRLLRAILPYYVQAATMMYNACKQFSPAREFWIRVMSNCLPMELEAWSFDRLDDRHDSLLKHLLQSLESSVIMDQVSINEEFISSPFPRLETLRCHVDAGIDNIEHPFDDVVKIATPKTPQACNHLLILLQDLSRAIKDNNEYALPEETASLSKSKPILTPVLFELFSTISKYFNCKCVRPHKAILLLSTHRTLPEKGLHYFTMLLNRGRMKNCWKETSITVKELTPEPQVRIMLPDSPKPTDESNLGPRASVPVPDLCKSLETTLAPRLSLSIEQGSLYQRTGSGLDMDGISTYDSLSLSDGLFTNETELGLNGKLCLSVVLSYALLDFCGEPWFPSGWTRNGIFLLQSGPYLSLRPALIASMQRTLITQPSNISNDLKLLFHGILLMEIFQQEPLSILPKPGGDLDIGKLREKALEKYDAMDWDVCEQYRLSVEACIRGLQCSQSLKDNDEDSFARLFCQRIIRPLEADYTSLWGNRDPDEVITEVKLPSVKRKRPPSPGPKPAHFQLLYQKSGKSNQVHQITSAPLKFFDAVDNPEGKQIAGANQWFKRFDQVHIQEQLPKRAKERNNRIKIAVLDTGINLNNPWIQQKAGRIQCWPNKDVCVDTDGHGTQVAYLLLRLAPHVQLRIAKVAKSQFIRDVDIKDIAKAIEHFSSDDFNRVDIINLSFGFPSFHERLRPILNAIRTARQNNVLVFAATGNEGGNQGIFWPAQLHETGDVICINASDSDGNASSFNPTVGSRNRICTLGEAVPSCDKDIQQRLIHRSGTSFATPIAVAIAAIVLGFVDNVHSGDGPNDFADLSRRLHTKLGMERVLHTTCVLAEGKRRAGFSYITPWFFLGIEERSRVHIIANELRSIPE